MIPFLLAYITIINILKSESDFQSVSNKLEATEVLRNTLQSLFPYFYISCVFLAPSFAFVVFGYAPAYVGGVVYIILVSDDKFEKFKNEGDDDSALKFSFLTFYFLFSIITFYIL